MNSDLYGPMLEAVQAWLKKHHPQAKACGVYVWVSNELPPIPPIRITILASACSEENLSAPGPS
jgi:hypothetical protein